MCLGRFRLWKSTLKIGGERLQASRLRALTHAGQHITLLWRASGAAVAGADDRVIGDAESGLAARDITNERGEVYLSHGGSVLALECVWRRCCGRG